MNIEKYGITDAHYLCDSAIFNTETNEILRLYQICDLLNQQNQRIAELQHQLKVSEKALELACSKLQEIYYVGDGKVLDKFSFVFFDMLDNQTINDYFKQLAEKEVENEL